MSREERRLSFGAHAAEYERARPEWPAEAARWLVPEGAELVVEVGAGTGKLTRALALVAPRVVAVEPDPRMRELHPDAVDGSAESIPLGDGEADAVVAGSALHWFDLERALPEFRRVLGDRGRLGFGWNHRDDVLLAEMSAAVRSVRPAGESWRSRDWAAEVAAGGLFSGLEHERFEHVLELPRGELRAHLLSYSGIARLPEAERDALLERLEPTLAPFEWEDGAGWSLPFVVDAYRATVAV
ncbi:MAG TPA: class I SAM-dependent methyltransferase [Gaiellaceae bacterium]|nr:class I SAM-dependent methyltransferase [Gaiellaceae bacterium]